MRQRFETKLGRRLLLALAVLLVPAVLVAAERRNLRPGQFNPDDPSVDLFAAKDSGQLDVKFIVKNDKEANLLIENKTDKPLNVKLPKAFAGVPVLAQFGGGGMAGGMGMGGMGGGGGSQGVGGGMGGMGMGGGGMGGMGGGGGAGFFNVPPERVNKLEVPVVCLDHGKSNPRAAIPYDIRPLSTYDDNPALAELMEAFGMGRLNQRAVQAAAWVLRGDLTWRELAAKRIRRANGASYPYFRRAELAAAFRYVQLAEEAAKDRPTEKSPGLTSPGEQTAAK